MPDPSTGRPRLPAARRRSVRLSLRVTLADARTIRAAALRSGRSLAEWLRAIVLGEVAPSTRAGGEG